jgi:hypothetical protein
MLSEIIQKRCAIIGACYLQEREINGGMTNYEIDELAANMGKDELMLVRWFKKQNKKANQKRNADDVAPVCEAVADSGAILSDEGVEHASVEQLPQPVVESRLGPTLSVVSKLPAVVQNAESISFNGTCGSAAGRSSSDVEMLVGALPPDMVLNSPLRRAIENLRTMAANKIPSSGAPGAESQTVLSSVEEKSTNVGTQPLRRGRPKLRNEPIQGVLLYWLY